MNIKTLLGSSLQRRRRIVNQLDICVINWSAIIQLSNMNIIARCSISYKNCGFLDWLRTGVNL